MIDVPIPEDSISSPAWAASPAAPAAFSAALLAVENTGSPSASCVISLTANVEGLGADFPATSWARACATASDPVLAIARRAVVAIVFILPLVESVTYPANPDSLIPVNACAIPNPVPRTPFVSITAYSAPSSFDLRASSATFPACSFTNCKCSSSAF